MIKQETFVTNYYQFAKNAGAKYHLNPYFILCVGAIEGGWGESYSVINRKNHFGIIASGKRNIYWSGAKSQSQTGNGLSFRIYKTHQDGFYDFARLIREHYPEVANATNPQDFANALSASKYISVANGDDPEIYRKGLVGTYNSIVAIAQKKNLIQ